MEPIARLADVWMPVFAVHTLECSLFILLVWAVDRMTRPRRPLRYALYLLALAKIFIPPVFSLPAPLSEALPAPLPFRPIVAGLEGTTRPEGIPLSALLFLLWAGSALFLGGMVLRQNLALRRRLKEASPVSLPPGVRGQGSGVGFLGSIFPDPRSPAPDPAVVFSCPALSAPLLTGLFRPRLYLPADWAAWPALHLRSILAHEAAHLRARDPWILVLQTLASVLFGLNPLVWFLNRRLNHLRELRCDEIAIRASGIPPVEYGKLLYAFLERQSGPAFLSMSGISFAGNACTLTGRFLHILTLPGTDPHRRWHAALPVLLALALVPLSNSLETGSGNAGPPAPKKTPSRDVVWTFVERTPVPVKVPRPVYPEQARRAGIEGTVYSQVLVDVTGKVLDAKVVSGDRIFHESVKEAARRSLWEPALRKDEPVTVWTYFPSITFKLRESGS